MKIEFSEEEYRRMVDVVTLAGMVLDAYGRGEESSRKPYFELEQKIYSYLEDADCRDLLRREVSNGQYVRKWSKDRSETIVRIHDEYIDDCFWDELIFRMADRDMKAELALKGIDPTALDPKELDDKRREFEVRYDRELRANGLSDLVLRLDNSEGPN